MQHCVTFKITMIIAVNLLASNFKFLEKPIALNVRMTEPEEHNKMQS